MPETNIAEQIAVDLSTGEFSDVESPLVLDIVTRTLEVLPDFGLVLMLAHD